MIDGETVKVHRRIEAGRDPGNNPIYEETVNTVEDVLVVPGALEDVTGAIRPEGVRILFTLHFPKKFTADLVGSAVSVRGGDPLDVIGHPARYTAANTPGRWNMPVEVGKVEG